MPDTTQDVADKPDVVTPPKGSPAASTPPVDTPPDTLSARPVSPAAGPLDHDADGKKGGAITKSQAAALVWVVRAGPGLHRMPRGEALEAIKDGETRLATPRDLAIAGIEQED